MWGGCRRLSHLAPVSLHPGPPGPLFSLHHLPLDGKSPKDQSTFQKLLHINATAQLEHPEYTGALLPTSALVPSPSALEQKMTPLQKELQETLKGLLGSADKGSFMVATQYGWVLGEDPSSPSLPANPLCSPGCLFLNCKGRGYEPR